nr:VOC family protein [Paenactinomyces guangxiensis]
MHHVGIEVRNLQRSIQFYRKWFGFLVERTEILGGERLAFLKLNDFRIELVEDYPRSSGFSIVHLAFQVKDLKKTIEEMKKQGLKITEPVAHLENGWRNAFIQGPDQEEIELIEFPDQ